MIPDRIIEQDTLTTDGAAAAVEVRIPWYRALPGSCIAGAVLRIDGVAGRRGLAALDHERPHVHASTSSSTRPASGGSRPTPPCSRATCPIEAGDAEHEVDVDLKLYIPYIVIAENEVLHIEEHDTQDHEGGAAMNDALGTPIQGVTLYSFTRAFHAREYDLEGLIRKVAADGYGPGLEVIGFSSFRGFPEIDDRFAGRFRDLVDEVGLVTTSLAVNADIGIHRDRLLTQDELIEYMRRQIEAAAKLGFPIARVQISLTPDSMEQLAPIAEQYGVTLALEVHADQYASHPRILALRDRYEQVGSPFLGFTADWGATVTGFAPSLLEAYRRRGASEDLLAKVVDLWNGFYEQGPPADQAEHGQRFGAFIGLAAQNGRPDLGIDFAHQRHRPVRPRAASTTGSRSCRGSATCTASSSASTSTARSPRCPCATSSRCSSRTATTARSRASTRAGTGTTGRARSRSSPASRPCSARPPRRRAPA